MRISKTHLAQLEKRGARVVGTKSSSEPTGSSAPPASAPERAEAPAPSGSSIDKKVDANIALALQLLESSQSKPPAPITGFEIKRDTQGRISEVVTTSAEGSSESYRLEFERGDDGRTSRVRVIAESSNSN